MVRGLRLTLFHLFFISYLSQIGYAQVIDIFFDDRASLSATLSSSIQNTYTNAGFNSVNVTTGQIDSTVNNSNYDLILIREAYNEMLGIYMPNFLNSQQQEIAKTFIQNGGHIIWISESWSTNPIDLSPLPEQMNMINTVNSLYGTSIANGPSYSDFNPDMPRIHPSVGPGGLSSATYLNSSSSYSTLLNVPAENAVYTSGTISPFTACDLTTLALFPEFPKSGEGTIIASTELQNPFFVDFSPLPFPGYSFISNPELDNSIAKLHYKLITGQNMDSINDWMSTISNTNLDCFPIVLGSLINDFEADCNTHSVTLSWNTTYEFSNDFFTLLKSSDGVNFDHLVDIPSVINSGSLTKYTWVDSTLLMKDNVYYKLLQTDMNGVTTEYKTIVTSCIDQMNNILLYPNPSKDIISIVTNESGMIEIMDLKGQVYLVTEINKGVTSISIEHLQPGLMILRVKSANGTTENIKIQKY